MGFPARSVGELVFLYTKHPELLDGSIFSEGRDDKAIFDAYIKRRSAGDFYVYCMENVDFSGYDIRSYGLSFPSNRSKVIALRKILVDSGISVDRARFVVDRDLEDFVTTSHIHGVFVTDAGALPVQLFDNSVEMNIAEIVLRESVSYGCLKNSVVAICSAIFSLRVVNSILDLGMKFLPPVSNIYRSESGGFELDVSSYAGRCLVAGRVDRTWGDIEDHYSSVRDDVGSRGYRGYRVIGDHDLYYVLKAIFDLVAPSLGKSESDVKDMIFCSFDADKLSAHSLFSAVFQS